MALGRSIRLLWAALIYTAHNTLHCAYTVKNNAQTAKECNNAPK